MATLSEKIQCERDAREMLRRDGLPDPDRVEYGHTCIRLFWEDSKLVLVVEIDEPPEGFEVVGDYVDDLHDLGLEDAGQGPSGDDIDETEEAA